MKTSLLITLIFLILTMANLASAELYKYYDESGTLCVTDNLSLVPVSQRPSAETLIEIKSSAPKEDQSESSQNKTIDPFAAD